MAILISRVFGFVRDVCIAGFFGTSAAAQAFVVAFRLPNLLRDLVAEGAASSALVPVLSTVRATSNREHYAALVWSLGSVLLAILLALTAAGVLAAPWLVRLLAPGFVSDPAKLALTVDLTRWIFPFLVLIGLTAYTTSLLHVQQRFVAAAHGQTVFNLAMIAVCLWLAPRISPPVFALAVGVLLGGAAQWGLTLPSVMRLGIGAPRRVTWRHPGVRQIGRLLLPRLIGAGVYQLDLFVDTILASLAWIVGEGGVAAMYFANRIAQLPIALFSFSMSTVALPTLSQLAAEGQHEKFRQTVQSALRSMWAMMVPASVGLVVLALPIVQVLYQRGAFSQQAAYMTAGVVGCASAGLFAYGGARIIVTALYAMQDTVTPLRIAGWALLINVACDLALMRPLSVAGLALGTTISTTCNFFWLGRLLERRLGRRWDPSLWSALGRMTAAALLMGGIAWWAWLSRAAWWHLGMGRDAGALVAVIVGSIGVYTVLSAWLRVPWWVELGWWRSQSK